jgi:hypothetical protein
MHALEIVHPHNLQGDLSFNFAKVIKKNHVVFYNYNVEDQDFLKVRRVH